MFKQPLKRDGNRGYHRPHPTRAVALASHTSPEASFALCLGLLQ